MSTGKVSFTIRRPSPVSRASSSDRELFKVPIIPRHISNGNGTSSPLARSTNNSPKPNSRTYHDRDSDSDSSGEDGIADELVTGFDQFGVQRLNGKRKVPQGPLVIPALQNKDWRDLAKKRKNAGRYVPPSAAASTGKDGSVGGLGTRDTINSGPIVSGLQVKQKRVKVEAEDAEMDNVAEALNNEEVKKDEETEDQKALRALLSGADVEEAGPLVDVIKPVTEDEAYKQDVEELPAEATLDDYARVPVAQFGAALLRGMGWKEGSAATRKQGKSGMIEPWVPTARPALLGIGAKEREVIDDGSGKGNGKTKRPERRYVPVVKQMREGSGSGSGTPSGSRSVSRRGSRSPSPERRHKRRDYDEPDRDRRRHGDREREHDRRRDRSRESNKIRRDY